MVADPAKSPGGEILLCSECFIDEGLRVGAAAIGKPDSELCPNCKKQLGHKLTRNDAYRLAYEFFTLGSRVRGQFGDAPTIVSNQSHETDIQLASWSGNDLELLEAKLGLGFFFYGPRLWMLGEVEPLKALQNPTTQAEIIQRVLSEYPSKYLEPGDKIYRLRKGTFDPSDQSQYDSPPSEFLGEGRLESPDNPIFYGSFDVETCIHECRLTLIDTSFLATVTPTARMKLLDLTHLLREEGVTEFESLDMAIHMLFLAAEHSYHISRSIAAGIRDAGFDGLIYPSFFSLARTGAEPFPTVLGISLRRIPEYEDFVSSKTVPNVAIFGHPVKEGKVKLACINSLVLGSVSYGFVLGPTGVTQNEEVKAAFAVMPPPTAAVAIPETLSKAMALQVEDLNEQFASGQLSDHLVDALRKYGLDDAAIEKLKEIE